ncbi:MAG TPA: fructose bisphosphate aldolase [Phenylobacterium sp.]|jgi:fructose-bisphosphate aldolase class I|uniref:fructose bisphosphate aldolase n=1 Tax=Phenylobacterium sp. TaxID=1871053 RepID=UPI002D26F953|nr:fructose bisphosphate aldolase [Phenylobacterium sp.]HZZ67951.1 fructose bisphosphate aldolase [Phenylobacterium sp.]
MNDLDEMRRRVADGRGFFAALDQSGGSTPSALDHYGVPRSAYRSDEEMFRLIHEMRVRIMTAPAFTGERILGAILFVGTMDGAVAGVPTPTFLWRERGIVPFVKVDQGLEDEADGVQVMKPMPDLAPTLARARDLGVFGTKARSAIHRASKDGIAAVVDQQFEVGEQVSRAGLTPILEAEVLIDSPDKAAAEAMLRDALLRGLDALPEGRQVILKLTLPEQPDLYRAVAAHDRVDRVVALSGGYSQDEACARLRRNHQMIASFSRALIGGLRVGMTDAEFDAALGEAIARVYAASVEKTSA